MTVVSWKGLVRVSGESTVRGDAVKGLATYSVLRCYCARLERPWQRWWRVCVFLTTRQTWEAWLAPHKSQEKAPSTERQPRERAEGCPWRRSVSSSKLHLLAPPGLGRGWRGMGRFPPGLKWRFCLRGNMRSEAGVSISLLTPPGGGDCSALTF